MMFEPHWQALTVVCSIAIYMVEFWLDVRQSRHLRKCPLPTRLEPYIDEVLFDRVKAYCLLRINFSRIESTFGLVMESLAVTTGFLVFLWEWNCVLVDSLFGSDAIVIQGVLYIFLVSLVSTVMKMPFELYRLLLLDAQFTGNPWQELGQWLSHQLVIFVISVLIGVPCVGAVLYLLTGGIKYQWLYIWVFMGILSVFLSDIYPNIAGLWFNQYQELSNATLKAEIEKLAEENDIQSVGVHLVDGSSWSSHSNASVIGIGDQKRIALCESLVKDLTLAEIKAILVHEFGHAKLHHNYKQLLLQFFSVGLFLYLFSQILETASFFVSFGFSTHHPAVGLIVFSYWYGSFAHLLSHHWFLHRYEYSADEYALRRGHDDLDTALIKMHISNLSNLVPDSLYSLYHFAHPSLIERLQHIDRIKQDKKRV